MLTLKDDRVEDIKNTPETEIQRCARIMICGAVGWFIGYLLAQGVKTLFGI